MTTPEIKADQVWMDVDGRIGVIVMAMPNGFTLQLDEYKFQIVPMEHFLLYKENCIYLGEL